MIDKDEIAQVLQFVSEYWDRLKDDSENDALKILPSKFWMKSLGGPVGDVQNPKGRWITTLMYTEDPAMDQAFKEVLTRWQTKGQQSSTSLPTIPITIELCLILNLDLKFILSLSPIPRRRFPYLMAPGRTNIVVSTRIRFLHILNKLEC